MIQATLALTYKLKVVKYSPSFSALRPINDNFLLNHVSILKFLSSQICQKLPSFLSISTYIVFILDVVYLFGFSPVLGSTPLSLILFTFQRKTEMEWKYIISLSPLPAEGPSSSIQGYQGGDNTNLTLEMGMWPRWGQLEDSNPMAVMISEQGM